MAEASRRALFIVELDAWIIIVVSVNFYVSATMYITPNLWNCTFHELGSLAAQFVKWAVSQIECKIYTMFSTWPFTRPSFRLSVRSFVTNLVTTIFWKRINRFVCKLAQVVKGATKWNTNSWGPGGQISRSHDAKVRFGVLGRRVQQPTGRIGRTNGHWYDLC